MGDKNRIGFGMAAIGRPLYINLKQKPSTSFDRGAFRQKGATMLEKAYALGIRYFDTAPGYGMAEALLLDWLSAKEDANVEVATKWGYTYVANFDPNAARHEVKEHSVSKLNEQWEVSKAILPHLTTYQIHSATLETGVLNNKDVLSRLAELKEEYGLHIGLSTTGANHIEVLKKGLEVAVEGKGLFDAFQATYNIFDQSLANVATDIAAQGKRLIIKEAMANGRILPNKAYPHYSKTYDYLAQLAEQYEVGPDAIALRFCMDSIPAFKVLSGAATERHLIENLKAASFKLEEEAVERLKAYAVPPGQYWTERKQLQWN